MCMMYIQAMVSVCLIDLKWLLQPCVGEIFWVSQPAGELQVVYAWSALFAQLHCAVENKGSMPFFSAAVIE